MIHTTDVDYVLRYNSRNSNRHERSAKYQLCKALGFHEDNSRRMRDWTLSHISLCYQKNIIKGDCNGK